MSGTGLVKVAIKVALWARLAKGAARQEITTDLERLIFMRNRPSIACLKVLRVGLYGHDYSTTYRRKCPARMVSGRDVPCLSEGGFPSAGAFRLNRILISSENCLIKTPSQSAAQPPRCN